MKNAQGRKVLGKFEIVEVEIEKEGGRKGRYWIVQEDGHPWDRQFRSVRHAETEIYRYNAVHRKGSRVVKEIVFG